MFQEKAFWRGMRHFYVWLVYRFISTQYKICSMFVKMGDNFDQLYLDIVIKSTVSFEIK